MEKDYAYRFEYADESAFVVYQTGEAFIEFPEKNGKRRKPEQKFGKIDNRIPRLIGMVAKPRHDEITRLRRLLDRAAACIRHDHPDIDQWDDDGCECKDCKPANDAYRLLREIGAAPPLDFEALEKNRLAIEENRRAGAMIEEAIAERGNAQSIIDDHPSPKDKPTEPWERLGRHRP